MVPDGVLPLWLSALGWMLALLGVGTVLWRVRNRQPSHFVPRLAAMTALMATTMSFGLLPLGYEPHLSALAGIVVGPGHAVLVALMFNLLRATVGDGAFTNIGLNTLITSIEMLAGWVLFRAAQTLFGCRASVAASGASIVSLMLGSTLFLAIIGTAELNPSRFGAVEAARYNSEIVVSSNDGIDSERPAPTSFLRFATALILVASVGWILESILTAVIVSFLVRVRPDLFPTSPNSENPVNLNSPLEQKSSG